MFFQMFKSNNILKYKTIKNYNNRSMTKQLQQCNAMQVQWESHGGAPLGMFPTEMSIQIIYWFFKG